MSKPIVLSGCQPSGELTIGNYLGALKQWVNMQPSHECYYMLVDQHAITVRPKAEDLRKATLDGLALYLACGVDPAQSTIFIQSHVPEHAQLSWVLNCYTQMGELNRMTQYKDKSQKSEANMNSGLFTYPVLMAADILLYRADKVPVGDDQKQHLELCRDIAQKFNNDFEKENFLQVPEPLIQKHFSRIMSLKDGSKKMSKSEISDLSRINLTDDKDQIINKIKKAKTDPMPMPKTVSELEERLEAKNLIGIYASLTNSNIEKSVESFIGKNFSEFKEKLSEVLVDKIEPISLEIKKLLNDQTYLNNILQVGAEKANSIASKKIQNI